MFCKFGGFVLLRSIKENKMNGIYNVSLHHHHHGNNAMRGRFMS